MAAGWRGCVALHNAPRTEGACASHPTKSPCLAGMPRLRSCSWCRFALTGWMTWFAWRLAYLTKIASWWNHTAVASKWLATLAFSCNMRS